MNPIIDSQALYGITTFIFSILLGAGCGVVLLLFKLLRALSGCRAIWVFIQDILFCLICGAAVFIFALVFCDGIIRGYVLAGSGIGGALFYFTVGEVVMRCERAITDFIYRGLAKIRRTTAAFRGKKVGKSDKTHENA